MPDYPAIVALGRSWAESRMTSTVAVMRPTGNMVVDGNGYEVPEWATVYASVPMRLAGLRSGPAQSQTESIGGADVEQAIRAAHFPAATSDLRDGDLIEVVSGENVGGVFRVVETGWQDQSTARRVPVIAAERPGEWL